MGDGVIPSVCDLNFHAQTARRFFRSGGLLDLIVVIVGGLWALYQYMDRPAVKMEMSYDVCVSDRPEKCPTGSMALKASEDVIARPDLANSIIMDWTKKACKKFSQVGELSFSENPMCPCVYAKVKCASG